MFADDLLMLHVRMVFHFFSLVINVGQIATALMLVAVSVLLMRRFIRGMGEKKQMEMEVEQARQVQQVLIPEALPHITGFEIESEYRPAEQVGGDFFQIVPLAGGSVLLVIGDVSGKGMPAAMTVSLLVGTVRTLARFTRSPQSILEEMNVRMLGRGRGGFTTCLIVRVDSNGKATMANAGHLAPYCQGNEVAVLSGLPLGLNADSTYPETEFRLGTGEQLTLLTDGVAEARNAEGKLFGFEGAARISTLGAIKIAEAAQQFGQQDDITVLTLKRVATQIEPATEMAAAHA
jgi:serine phosphatase RsbU (regulator of sigma subunit)